jgi:hypothetical protein
MQGVRLPEVVTSAPKAPLAQWQQISQQATLPAWQTERHALHADHDIRCAQPAASVCTITLVTQCTGGKQLSGRKPWQRWGSAARCAGPAAPGSCPLPRAPSCTPACEHHRKPVTKVAVRSGYTDPCRLVIYYSRLKLHTGSVCKGSCMPSTHANTATGLQHFRHIRGLLAHRQGSHEACPSWHWRVDRYEGAIGAGSAAGGALPARPCQPIRTGHVCRRCRISSTPVKTLQYAVQSNAHISHGCCLARSRNAQGPHVYYCSTCWPARALRRPLVKRLHRHMQRRTGRGRLVCRMRAVPGVVVLVAAAAVAAGLRLQRASRGPPKGRDARPTLELRCRRLLCCSGKCCSAGCSRHEQHHHGCQPCGRHAGRKRPSCTFVGAGWLPSGKSNWMLRGYLRSGAQCLPSD